MDRSIGVDIRSRLSIIDLVYISIEYTGSYTTTGKCTFLSKDNQASNNKGPLWFLIDQLQQYHTTKAVVVSASAKPDFLVMETIVNWIQRT